MFPPTSQTTTPPDCPAIQVGGQSNVNIEPQPDMGTDPNHLAVPGWLSRFAGAGQPRRGSVGFSDGLHLGEAPTSIDEDSNPGTSVCGSIVIPRASHLVPGAIQGSRSPASRRRGSLVDPSTGPSPIEDRHDYIECYRDFLF